jgi:nucleoside-diphosphate-sugar epimerase
MSDQVEIITGDLSDRGALEKFCAGARGAILYHCAGLIHPVHFVSELYRVNVEGSRNLCQVAEAAGVRRVVAVSSISPIGNSYATDYVFDESAPYHPYMNYGRSKMMMEKILHEFQARGKLQTAIVRATWFYGPGQPERQDTFFKMIRTGKAPILGTGNNRRSMTYIDNLCQIMLLCEIKGVANGQTYWAADRRPYTVNEIVDTVERLLKNEFDIPVSHKRLRLPFWVGDVAMWSDRLIQRVGLYQQKIHVLGEYNKTVACSVAKGEKELGYRPTIELEEGMRRSIAWCLANKRPI